MVANLLIRLLSLITINISISFICCEPALETIPQYQGLPISARAKQCKISFNRCLSVWSDYLVTWLSLITKGGANLMIFPWVGFASNPFSAIDMQISQANSSSPGLELSISKATNKPLPRTFLTKSDEALMLDSPSIKALPCLEAFSASFSSTKT